MRRSISPRASLSQCSAPTAPARRRSCALSAGLIRPIVGEVSFLGARIDQLPGDRIARDGLILVPEGRQVFPELSVIDNLRLGAYARAAADETQMIDDLLERFGALKARADISARASSPGASSRCW